MHVHWGAEETVDKNSGNKKNQLVAGIQNFLSATCLKSSNMLTQVLKTSSRLSSSRSKSNMDIISQRRLETVDKVALQGRADSQHKSISIHSVCNILSERCTKRIKQKFPAF